MILVIVYCLFVGVFLMLIFFVVFVFIMLVFVFCCWGLKGDGVCVGLYLVIGFFLDLVIRSKLLLFLELFLLLLLLFFVDGVSDLELEVCE